MGTEGKNVRDYISYLFIGLFAIAAASLILFAIMIFAPAIIPGHLRAPIGELCGMVDAGIMVSVLVMVITLRRPLPWIAPWVALMGAIGSLLSAGRFDRLHY